MSQCHVKAVPIRRLLQTLLLLPVLGGRTYPKILCTMEKEDRKRENSDIAWRRSSLSRDVSVKHLVKRPGNASKTRPSHLTTADVSEGLGLEDLKGPQGPSEDADPEFRQSNSSLDCKTHFIADVIITSHHSRWQLLCLPSSLQQPISDEL